MGIPNTAEENGTRLETVWFALMKKEMCILQIWAISLMLLEIVHYRDQEQAFLTEIQIKEIHNLEKVNSKENSLTKPGTDTFIFI